MRKAGRTILLAITPTTLVASVLTGPTSASVATVPALAQPGPATTSTDGTVTAAAEVARVERYWTPERMRRAIPAPAPAEDGPATSATTAEPTGPAGADAPAPAQEETARYQAASANGEKVVGKVLFTKPDGRDSMCSASAVNSRSKQLVITAAHCVHEGRGGGWMRNWVFIPQYDRGQMPYGMFVKKQFRTFDAWIKRSDRRRDVAVVTTFPRRGHKLVNVVGGLGFAWNRPPHPDFRLLFIGYPSNNNNHGASQSYCYSRIERVSSSDPRLRSYCTFGRGASGGPWILNYSEPRHRWRVNGVGAQLTPRGNVSPYFDGAVKAMKDAQGNVT